MGVFDCTLGRMLTPEEEAARPSSPTVRGVPIVVTRYQFLAAIRASGRAADLKAYILTLPEGQQEAWQNKRILSRASAMIEAARVALGVSNAAVDNLFRTAEDIED